MSIEEVVIKLKIPISYLVKKKNNVVVFTTRVIYFESMRLILHFVCTFTTTYLSKSSAVYVTLSMLSIAQTLLQVMN